MEKSTPDIGENIKRFAQESVCDGERFSRLKEHKKLILLTLLSEFRVAVIALRRIVRPVFNDKSNFMAVHLAVVCGVRELQEYFFSDGEVSPLLSRKVLFDKLAVGASKVVEGVGEVLADIDFAVWIGDLVNDLHCLLLTSLIILFSRVLLRRSHPIPEYDQ